MVTVFTASPLQQERQLLVCMVTVSAELPAGAVYVPVPPTPLLLCTFAPPPVYPQVLADITPPPLHPPPHTHPYPQVLADITRLLPQSDPIAVLVSQPQVCWVG